MAMNLIGRIYKGENIMLKMAFKKVSNCHNMDFLEYFVITLTNFDGEI